MSVIKLSDLTLKADVIVGVIEPRQVVVEELYGFLDLEEVDEDGVLYQLPVYVAGSTTPIFISYGSDKEKAEEDYKKILTILSDKLVGRMTAR